MDKLKQGIDIFNVKSRESKTRTTTETSSWPVLFPTVNLLLLLISFLSLTNGQWSMVNGQLNVMNESATTTKSNQFSVTRSETTTTTIPSQLMMMMMTTTTTTTSKTSEIDSEIDTKSEFESEILPKFLTKETGNYFGRDSVDIDQVKHIDCHLRNIDFCYAGMIGSSGQLLPENDKQLENRCDEFRLTATCLALYNERCMSFKAFGLLGPMLNMAQLQSSSLNKSIESVQLMNGLDLIQDNSNSNSNSKEEEEEGSKLNLSDMFMLCDPRSREKENLVKNKRLRAKLFSIGKCINSKVPGIIPCINDLKTSIQLLYEPGKYIPTNGACCGYARFKHCAIEALDNICGLSSFDQLANALTSGPANSLRLVDRICKGRSFLDHNSQVCRDLLPPSGLKLAPRRGSKASKLAKALDLLSLTNVQPSQSVFK